jgi:hypothetical protein
MQPKRIQAVASCWANAVTQFDCWGLRCKLLGIDATGRWQAVSILQLALRDTHCFWCRANGAWQLPRRRCRVYSKAFGNAAERRLATPLIGEAARSPVVSSLGAQARSSPPCFRSRPRRSSLLGRGFGSPPPDPGEPGPAGYLNSRLADASSQTKTTIFTCLARGSQSSSPRRATLEAALWAQCPGGLCEGSSFPSPCVLAPRRHCQLPGSTGLQPPGVSSSWRACTFPSTPEEISSSASASAAPALHRLR